MAPVQDPDPVRFGLYFVPSLLWNVDEGVVAGLKVEGGGPLDDQVDHLKICILRSTIPTLEGSTAPWVT